MKNTHSKAIAGVVLALAILTSAFMLPLMTAPTVEATSWYTAEIRIMFVKITSHGSSRSHEDLHNWYGGAWYEARAWWYLRYGIPIDAWVDDNPSFEYTTFSSMIAFKYWWENNPAAREDQIFFVDTEEHYEYWWGAEVRHGDHRGSIYNGDFSAYIYTRIWGHTTHAITNLPPDWAISAMKRTLGHSIGMESCWYGWFPGVDCLFEDGFGYDPGLCNDLCWLCYNAVYDIKQLMGWN